jgi:hypothetical protein
MRTKIVKTALQFDKIRRNPLKKQERPMKMADGVTASGPPGDPR